MNTHKIVNRKTGLEIEGKLEEARPREIDFQIEGTTGSNTLWAVDWEIIELPKPLPTEPGYYVQANTDLAGDVTLYHCSPGRFWYSDERGAWTAIDRADVPRDLVRLVKREVVAAASAEPGTR